jgi:glycyl-tRNA synthetase
MSVGKAVNKGIIANQMLRYFVARIYQLLIKIGINPERFRFRRHVGNVMAHYATDCRDAELHNSMGWTECVGKEVADWNKKNLGKTYRQDAGVLQKLVEAMKGPELLRIKGKLIPG